MKKQEIKSAILKSASLNLDGSIGLDLSNVVFKSPDTD